MRRLRARPAVIHRRSGAPGVSSSRSAALIESPIEAIGFSMRIGEGCGNLKKDFSAGLHDDVGLEV